MYAYTIVSIFIDIRKRGDEYQKLIEGDLAKMNELELDPKKL
jgi:hypothetical protein